MSKSETKPSAIDSSANNAESPAASPLPSLLQRLFAPVPIDFLVYFRIALGAIMLWEVWRYLNRDWVRTHFIDPQLQFTYYGFSWVRPWPSDGMYWHFYALGLLALCMMLGLCYRLAATLFFLAFTYVFLLDQTYYLNHFYLICLISLTMIFLPAHRAVSLDALMRPRLRSATVPAWTLGLLRFQIGVVYVYGALAKLNRDWLTGNPIRRMLDDAPDFPIIGRWFHEEAMIYGFAYGGLLLDLLIIPALLWKRTRLLALLATAVFHLSNDMLFQIGIFPWFMMTATLILFPPRRLEPLWFLRTMLAVVYVYANLSMLNIAMGDDAPVRYAGMAVSLLMLPLLCWKPARIPAFLVGVGWLLMYNLWFYEESGLSPTFRPLIPSFVIFSIIVVFPPDFLRSFRFIGDATDDRTGEPRPRASWRPAQMMTTVLLGFYVAFQLLVPLRHWLYPGDVNWTDEGHRFSWRMKLRYKERGQSTFTAYDAAGNIIPDLASYGFLLCRRDAAGRFTHILDAKGRPVYKLSSDSIRRIYALEIGKKLRPVYELHEENGYLMYELDAKGKPIYELNDFGQRIDTFDENGNRQVVRDENGDEIPERDPPYLLDRRQRYKLAGRPDMILQYAHMLAKLLEDQGYEGVQIRARVTVSLNGREVQPLVDPDVDLAAQKRSLKHSTWILPLDPKLRPLPIDRSSASTSN